MTNTERPNIILVVLDTVRARSIGFYGHNRETMPNLRQFGEDATVFKRAYTNAPWTLPAHASLFTGQLPSEHGCHGGSLYFDPSDPTLPERLRDQGYTTTGFSNNIWISDHFGFERGFDSLNKQWQLFPKARDIGHVLKTNPGVRSVAKTLITGNPLINLANGIYGKWFYRRTDFGGEKTSADAIEWLDSNEEPFFLFLNYMEAHAPYQHHENSTTFLDTTDGVDDLTKLSRQSKAFHLSDREIDKAEFERLRSLYDGELRYLDYRLGQLFQELDERDLRDNTMVVIVGDHGENIGEHGLMAHRFSVHDTVLQVPLVVSYPDGEVPSTDPKTPVDLRYVFKEIVRMSGMAADNPRNGGPVISEYIDPGYAPEASTVGFKGSRFNKRYTTAITNKYKLVLDDSGDATLFVRDGRDFEIDGYKIEDETIVSELSEHCTPPEEVTNSATSDELSGDVVQHLETLGYR